MTVLVSDLLQDYRPRRAQLWPTLLFWLVWGLLRGDVGGSGAMLRHRRQSVEDAAEAHHLRILRMRQLHLDDLDAEERTVHIRLRQILAAREFFLRTHPRRTRDIDVDHALVLRVGDHGVRVRPTAGLDILHLLGVGRIADVIDANSHHAVHADDEAEQFRDVVAVARQAPGHQRPTGLRPQRELDDHHAIHRRKDRGGGTQAGPRFSDK